MLKQCHSPAAVRLMYIAHIDIFQAGAGPHFHVGDVVVPTNYENAAHAAHMKGLEAVDVGLQQCPCL